MSAFVSIRQNCLGLQSDALRKIMIDETMTFEKCMFFISEDCWYIHKGTKELLIHSVCYYDAKDENFTQVGDWFTYILTIWNSYIYRHFESFFASFINESFWQIRHPEYIKVEIDECVGIRTIHYCWSETKLREQLCFKVRKYAHLKAGFCNRKANSKKSRQWDGFE